MLKVATVFFHRSSSQILTCLRELCHFEHVAQSSRGGDCGAEGKDPAHRADSLDHGECHSGY